MPQIDLEVDTTSLTSAAEQLTGYALRLDTVAAAVTSARTQDPGGDASPHFDDFMAAWT